MIEHTVKGYHTSLSVRNGDLKGQLVDIQGRPIREYIPADSTDQDVKAASDNVGANNVYKRPATVAGDVLTGITIPFRFAPILCN
jgi:hypothetical protein